MRLRLFSVIPILAVLVVAPLCNAPSEAQEGVHLPFALEYRMHRGLDCYQIGDCGFRIEVAPDGRIQRFDDRGTWTLVGETQLSEQQTDDLVALFEDARFDQYPAELPHEDRVRGGVTVAITLTDVADGAVHHVEASLNDTSTPFPNGFLLFESQLRTFLVEAVPTDS